MKGFKMYNQIQQLKELGFTRSRAANQLKINRETVTRYWDILSSISAQIKYFLFFLDMKLKGGPFFQNMLCICA